MTTDPPRDPADEPEGEQHDDLRFGKTASFAGSSAELSGPDDELPEAPSKVGRFEVHGVLGRGGYGTVFLGYDDQLQRRVAIKVPRRALTGVNRDRFLEEARRLAQLRHSNIVTVFEAGDDDGCCYIVSDYLEGVSLKDWMRSRPYTWREAAQVVATLAEALAHAHAQGTVHRDVKPSNVIMLPDDQPVLVDFGLAISDAQGQAETPGLIAGTLAYMAPEQAAGKAHRIDGRTDIYGLGVLLYHLLCRKLPFASTNQLEQLRQISEDDPQPPRQIAEMPEPLEQACLKAMAKRIKDRFTTARDLADQLQRILAESDDSGAAAATNPVAEPVAAKDSWETRLHEAERRQITTLHVELDDTAVEVDDLDPEELHAVLQQVRELSARVIGRYEGHFAQSTSESIQAYFGYPRAFEDSAQRAVLAGLDIRDEIRRLQDKLRAAGEAAVEFQIGVHTGIVVTEEQEAEFSSERHTIVGSVPRVAAGLASLAESGTLVISSATRRITGEAFQCRSLGTHSGKAIGRDVELFEVLGPQQSREAPAHEDLPLIGREHEAGLLEEKWRHASGGAGQVTLICGEAGVGKSRLLAALRQSVGDEEAETLGVACSTYHQNSAFHPISQLLQRQAGFADGDSDETKLNKLEQLLGRQGIPLAAVIPLLADLVSIPLGPRYSVFDGTPERRKQQTIQSLVEWTLAVSEQRPLLVAVEDLHWVDPSTLEFLSVLIEQVPAARVLVVMTFRPSFTPPWPMRPSLSQMTIGQLSAEQTREVIQKIAGNRLPADIVSRIVDKTGGVPLFTEELTKAVLEADIWEAGDDEGSLTLAGPLDELAIPDTLQDSLMARLDRLGGAKEIAQLASVIGREFSYELLAAVAPLEDAALQGHLTRLVDAELLHQRGFFPTARFLFKHALVVDTAYGSLLRKSRRQWHDAIADALTSRFPELAEQSPELLARHYAEAGRVLPAISAWGQAGLRAQEASAHQEASSHFRKGLQLVSALDPSTERDQTELQFQVPLGVSLLSSQGYAAPEVGQSFERARELCGQLGGPAEQFPIVWGIWAWRVVREELNACLEYVEQAADLAAAAGDPGMQAEALFIPILTKFYLGEFEAACGHCERALPLLDDESTTAYARYTGQNLGVTMRCYWALSLLYMGRWDQSFVRIQEAVELGRRLKHPFSLAYALGHAAWLYHSCGLVDELKRAADEELQLAKDEGFPFWVAEGLLHQGFHLRLTGRMEDSLVSLQAGLDVFNQTGAKLSLCHFYSELAQASLGAGDADEALRRIDQSLAASAANGNAFYLAEIHRIRGEILLAVPGDTAEQAAASFRRSLEIARGQQAKSWELRTTISLCRLQQSHGGGEARNALAELLPWFQQQAALPDIEEARRLAADA